VLTGRSSLTFRFEGGFGILALMAAGALRVSADNQVAAPPVPPERARELLGQATVLLRRSVLTLRAVPDAERRYLASPRCSLPPSAPTYDPTYDAEALRSVTPPPKFNPSRADLGRYMEVLDWLAWLKRQGEFGERGAKIIAQRALGNSFWRIAKRQYGASDDTLRRWEVAAVRTILASYWPRIEELSK